MNYFGGTHNLVMLSTLCTFFSLFLQAALMVAGAVEGERYLLNNQLLLYSNREEMVKIAGYGDEKLSTVLVTGSVVCRQACLHADGEPHLRQWPIPGARVVVHCRQAKKSSWAEGVTDEFGDFVVDLPSHLHAILNLEKACSLKVVRLPNNSDICRPKSNYYLKKHNYSLTLSSVGDGIRTYNTGHIKFLHGASKLSASTPCMH